MTNSKFFNDMIRKTHERISRKVYFCKSCSISRLGSVMVVSYYPASKTWKDGNGLTCLFSKHAGEYSCNFCVYDRGELVRQEIVAPTSDYSYFTDGYLKALDLALAPFEKPLSLVQK
jgi:hypothetical protein